MGRSPSRTNHHATSALIASSTSAATPKATSSRLIAASVRVRGSATITHEPFWRGTTATRNRFDEETPRTVMSTRSEVLARARMSAREMRGVSDSSPLVMIGRSTPAGVSRAAYISENGESSGASSMSDTMSDSLLGRPGRVGLPSLPVALPGRGRTLSELTVPSVTRPSWRSTWRRRYRCCEEITNQAATPNATKIATSPMSRRERRLIPRHAGSSRRRGWCG